MKSFLSISLFFLFLLTFNSCKTTTHSDFVRVEGTQFFIGDKPYRFVGVNFWYGAYLGSPCEAGDRDRLIRELDQMVSLGITNLRVAASAEASPFKRSVEPVFLEAPGVVNEDLLVGLDFLLNEMAKRNMKAVLYLNNFWEWSGGMSTYLSWAGMDSIIDPFYGQWNPFMNQSALFYTNSKAQEIFHDYVRVIISRTNSVNGARYTEDPTIMSWQLANEPRPGAHDEQGVANIPVWINWIHSTAKFIKELAPNQLISTGNEGTMGSVSVAEAYFDAHSSPYVDYATFHFWPMNWRWFDASNPEEPIGPKLENVENYIMEHIELAQRLNKPIVLSEFGLNRDYGSFDIGSPVTYRDQYLQFIFNIIERELPNGSPLVGSNFWSWGGYGVGQQEDYYWQPGDPFTGDPPQEAQGLYSVFATDTSTLRVFKGHAKRLKAIIP